MLGKDWLALQFHEMNSEYKSGGGMSKRYMLKVGSAALVATSSMLAIGTASAQDAPAPASTQNVPAPPSTQNVPAPASAQDVPASTGAGALEEIVVTARRREENLLNVPIAVAVMSSTAIAASGVTDIRDLSKFTPGLFVQTQDGSGSDSRIQTRLTFRGLSTSSGVSFIDGAPYAGNGQPDIADVARVEVLKGPQSVYFGRSTFAGAVNYVTAPPSKEFGGRASYDASTYQGSDGRLMLEGPLMGDLLAMRVSARHYSFGGQYQNGYDRQRLGAESTDSATVALASSPTSKLNLSLYYAYTRDEDGPPANATIRTAGPGATLNCNLGGNGGDYWCGQLPTARGISGLQIGNYSILDPFTRSETLDNARGALVPFDPRYLDHFGLKRDINHVHGRANYDIGSGWEAALLAGYSQTKSAQLQGREGVDTSSTPNPFYITDPVARAAACAAPAGSAANQPCFAPQTVEQNSYTTTLVNDYNAELRVSSPNDKRLRTTVGASFFGFDSLAAGYGIQSAGRFISTGTVKSGASTPAVFGGVYFDLTDKLKLGAEARYQWDGINQQQLYPTQTANLHQVFTSFSPRFTVDYQLAPRSLLYATVSRGYRPGGFNPTLIGLAPSALAQLAGLGTNIAYQQEQLDNYEIGHKAQWLDNRLRTTVALYYMQYRNGQVTDTQRVVQPNGSTATLTDISNVGQIDLKGVELEADFAATEGLTLSGTLDYADNKYISYIYTPNGLRIRNSTNVNGNQTDNQPALTISFSPTYKRKLVNDVEGMIRLDYLYQGKIYVDPTNVAWRGPSDTLNARAGINKGRVSLEAYVNNVFDNAVFNEAIKGSETTLAPAAVCPPGCVNPPPPGGPGIALNTIGVGLPIKRTVGMRVSYVF